MKTSARRPKNQQQNSFQPSRRQLRRGAKLQQQTLAAVCSSTAAAASPKLSSGSKPTTMPYRGIVSSTPMPQGSIREIRSPTLRGESLTQTVESHINDQEPTFPAATKAAADIHKSHAVIISPI
jgi:hypothetical protein